MHGAEFAGPVAALHLVDGQVTALDDAQGIEQLRPEKIRPPAIIGERGDGDEHVTLAGVLAEVTFQSPERGENRRRHAKFLFNPGKERGVAFDLLLAVLHAVAGDHSIGEF